MSVEEGRETKVENLKSSCINVCSFHRSQFPVITLIVQDNLQSLAKIKKNTQLEFATVLDRLESVGANEVYPIHRAEKYITFSRMYLTYLYGGSFVSTFPRISEDRVNLHGIDNLGFPNLEFNPNAPVVPGAPGLLFTSRLNAFGNKPWVSKVFIPWKGDHTWGYMGDYRFIPAPSLSAEEFAVQNPAVRCAASVITIFLTNCILGTKKLGQEYSNEKLGKLGPCSYASSAGTWKGTLPERDRSNSKI